MTTMLLRRLDATGLWECRPCRPATCDLTVYTHVAPTLTAPAYTVHHVHAGVTAERTFTLGELLRARTTGEAPAVTLAGLVEAWFRELHDDDAPAGQNRRHRADCRRNDGS